MDGGIPTSTKIRVSTHSATRCIRAERFTVVKSRIEGSTDLANWKTIETNIIGADGVMTRFYSIEGHPRRFFRSRRN